MEPFPNLDISGPQLDDIRGIHRAYGDAFEKVADGRGNSTAAHAVSLGDLVPGIGLAVGTSVGIGSAGDVIVHDGEVDFVSIDDNSDIDFFSFEVATQSLLTATVTPVGPTYRIGPQHATPTYLDSSAVSDLTLTIFDSDGTSILALENANDEGFSEVIDELSLPAGGEYFARITGNANDVQMYQLDLDVVAVPEPVAALSLASLVALACIVRRRTSPA